MRKPSTASAAYPTRTEGGSFAIVSRDGDPWGIAPRCFIHHLAAPLLLICLLQSEAGAQISQVITYKPPIIPIKISLDDRANLSVQLSNTVSTPIGSFTFGNRALSVDETNTYFIVKNHDVEKLYCIGRRGKIRLHAEGKHEIEISNLQNYANVIIINIKAKYGNVQLDFIPDDSTDDLARVRHGAVDLVLRKSGLVIFDGTFSDDVYSRRDIKKIVFADMPSDKKMIVSVVALGNNTLKSEEMLCEDQQRIEALWLRECLRTLDYCKIQDLSCEKSFNGGRVNIFNDGSIFFRYVEAATEFQIHYGEAFLGADFIKDLEFQEPALLNLYRNGLTITPALPSAGKRTDYRSLLCNTGDLKEFVAVARKTLRSPSAK